MRPAKKFQSTKPQRLRQEILAPPVHKVHFNPRSRKGFDPAIFPFALSITISIHEAAKASTYSLNLRLEAGSISIHEAAKASTPSLGVNISPVLFQSTKPQRLRQETFFIVSALLRFQSTKPQRLRLITSLLKCKNFEFQSTKPQRLRQQKHPKNNLIFKNNLYTYYNIPTHNNYILIIFNLFTIKSTIFQVRISRDFHVHFLFAPNNSIIKYHH